MSPESLWYSRSRLALALLPLAGLFRLAVQLRRSAYRHGWLKVHRLPVPVVVVGNISVGGTGKTPLVVWLAHFLAQAGYSPGIVTRGYGGRAESWPQLVRPDSDPSRVGDEAVLLARRCACPVVAGPNRPKAAARLIEEQGCDLILADDGLQHYALARDIEIAVTDGVRRHGNGWCLPAGPLREPVQRLERVDLRVCNGGTPAAGEIAVALAPGDMVNLVQPSLSQPLAALRGEKVHAVAGIGYPERFFELLREAGLEVIAHPFRDHHAFAAEDIDFADDLPVLMTEKDAVKCRPFARPRHWYLPVEAQPDPALGAALLDLLRLSSFKRNTHGQEAA